MEPFSERRTLLVVDDNPDLLDFLRYGLADQFNIMTATDGVTGLAHFFENKPDCVIIDVKMPGLDGYQLVRALRGDAASAAVPLIILTALNHERDQFVGFASGTDRFLTKPVSLAELLKVIEDVLAISADERQRLLNSLATGTSDDAASPQ